MGIRDTLGYVTLSSALSLLIAVFFFFGGICVETQEKPKSCVNENWHTPIHQAQTWGLNYARVEMSKWMWLIDMQRFHSGLSWATFIQEQREKCGFSLLGATFTNGEGLRSCLGTFLGGITPDSHTCLWWYQQSKEFSVVSSCALRCATWPRVLNSQSV